MKHNIAGIRNKICDCQSHQQNRLLEHIGTAQSHTYLPSRFIRNDSKYNNILNTKFLL